MNETPLQVADDGRVRTLTLHRPDRLNAIDAALGAALLDALVAAADDASVGVVRLRGAGRAFCAGRDVTAPPTDRDLEQVQAVARAIVTHPLPVVAAVHGWTVGAGFEWMMAADLVLAATDARFKLPEASLGVFVTGGLVATLPATVGPMRAKALMLLGETVDATRAEAWGLVHEVVPPDRLDEASLAACRRLAELSPPVAAAFKRVVNRFGIAGFDEAIAAETAVQRGLQAGRA